MYVSVCEVSTYYVLNSRNSRNKGGYFLSLHHSSRNLEEKKKPIQLIEL